AAIKELHDKAVKILGPVTSSEDVLAEMLRLIDAFRDRASMIDGPSIAYWAHLEQNPPIFTWKEFKAVVYQWQPHRDASSLAELVHRQASHIGCSVDAAYRELFETTIAYRGNALNRASEVVPDQQLSAQMDDADTGLGLLTIVVHDQQGFERGRGVL